MPEWLTRALGVELPPLPAGGRRHFELGGLPEGEALLALIVFVGALIALTVWLYQREGAAASWQKAGLASLRVLVIVCAVFIFLDPRLGLEIEKRVPSVTIVLADGSRSMSVVDRFDDGPFKEALAKASGVAAYDIGSNTRAQLVEGILENPELDLLGRLAKRNDVMSLRFGSGLEPLARAASGEVTLEPGGQSTDLGKALRGALQEASGKTIAGVVLLSDGQHNVGEHPRGAAALLRDRGIPLYTVGIGDPELPKNVEVLEVRANPRVFKNDPVLFEGRLRASGYAGQSLAVQLELLDRATGATRVLGEQALELSGSLEDRAVSFKHTFSRSGEFQVSLKAEVLEGELVEDDNAASRVLEVIDDDTRVLLVSGGPSFEFRFLRNLLQRERSVQLSCWLQSADASFPQDGNIRIRGLPVSEKELFEYDVIVLLDPDPEGIVGPFVSLLERFVEGHGGGLCYVAGRHHSARLLRDPDARALLTLLPVVFDFARADRDALGGARSVDAWRYRLTPDGEDHVVTRLSSDLDQLKAVWSRLPGHFWAFPVRREKAGASALLRSGDPTRVGSEGAAIMLAAHFYGPGRAVFSATDESWRWRGLSRLAYQRYWVQLMRYLVEGRLLGGQRRMSMQTDKESYALGDLVRVNVKLLDRGFKPLSGMRLVGRAERRAAGELAADELEVLFRPRAGRPGRYQGRFTPDRQGVYELHVRAPDLELDENASPELTKSIRVRLPNTEFEDTRLDSALLADVAAVTGGRAIALDELTGLPELIPDRRETLVVTGSPVTLWDTSVTLFALLFLLSLEWWLRKRCRMV